ncbi:hypothetical protein F5Y17DRAFT_438743 [Xylariaceae sp. FL0594]|nr:hypothetical protein F5Y17DRAFT_438743 [Xylariaceae sp. FL0594]
MDKRTFEANMEFEWEDSVGPVDPSSPLTHQASKRFHNGNVFGTPSFGSPAPSQNRFAFQQNSPSKPLPPTPSASNNQSIFSAQRATAAPPFRNPAFFTPRKPFDIEPLSEASAAESSPAATDASDFPDTPDDPSFNMGKMTITQAAANSRRGALFPKKASGKGELSKTVFASRDKVRKRKRYNADKDVSGYRLPYIQQDECDDSDYESDESTFQPNSAYNKHGRRRKDGRVGSFFTFLRQHPEAPNILGYWLTFAFSTVCMAGTLWIGWTIIIGLREDFNAARSAVRDELLEEIARCRADYMDNKCFPKEQRLPAMHAMCEQWFACMNRNPDNVKAVQLGAKNIVEILNEIVDTMSYKTMGLLVLLFTIFVFSGRSLVKNANDFTGMGKHPAPAYNPPHPSSLAPQQVYWQAIQPQTPRFSRRMLANDETPDTDASPPKFQALLPPGTPSGRRSPSKSERGRSPAKSTSPYKRY